MTNDDLARRVETMLAMLERRGSVPGTISLIRDLWAQREADRRLIASTNQALTRALERAEEAEGDVLFEGVLHHYEDHGGPIIHIAGDPVTSSKRELVGRHVRVVAADPAPTDQDGRYHYICEAGHHIVSSHSNIGPCTARNENPDGPFGPPCGADIEWRKVPYEVAADPAPTDTEWTMPFASDPAPTDDSPYGPPGDEMADGPFLRELHKRHDADPAPTDPSLCDDCNGDGGWWEGPQGGRTWVPCSNEGCPALDMPGPDTTEGGR